MTGAVVWAPTDPAQPIPGQLPIDFGASNPWTPAHSWSAEVARLYDRHYSRERPGTGHGPGPGRKLCLVLPDLRGLFIWREWQFRMANQIGVWCSVFRNEAPELYRSSDLILAAEVWAMEDWSERPPEQPVFLTYVCPNRTRKKRDPGRCFRKAGWTEAGTSKGGLILFRKPMEQAGKA